MDCIFKSIVVYKIAIIKNFDIKENAQLVSWYACNTRVIVNASSIPPVSNVKSL